MPRKNRKKYNPYEHFTLKELLIEYLNHEDDGSEDDRHIILNEMVRNRVWNELDRRDKEFESTHQLRGD